MINVVNLGRLFKDTLSFPPPAHRCKLHLLKHLTQHRNPFFRIDPLRDAIQRYPLTLLFQALIPLLNPEMVLSDLFLICNGSTTLSVQAGKDDIVRILL